MVFFETSPVPPTSPATRSPEIVPPLLMEMVLPLALPSPAVWPPETSPVTLALSIWMVLLETSPVPPTSPATRLPEIVPPLLTVMELPLAMPSPAVWPPLTWPVTLALSI